MKTLADKLNSTQLEAFNKVNADAHYLTGQDGFIKAHIKAMVMLMPTDTQLMGECIAEVYNRNFSKDACAKIKDKHGVEHVNPRDNKRKYWLECIREVLVNMRPVAYIGQSGNADGVRTFKIDPATPAHIADMADRKDAATKRKEADAAEDKTAAMAADKLLVGSMTNGEILKAILHFASTRFDVNRDNVLSFIQTQLKDEREQAAAEKRAATAAAKEAADKLQEAIGTGKKTGTNK